MKFHDTLKIVTITISLSSSVWADTGNLNTDQTEMPIVVEGNASPTMESQNQQKRITTRERPIKHHRHHYQPILGSRLGHQLMAIEHHQTESNHHHHMPGMDGENHSLMNMSQQHMAKIEQRLANIEALLEKLVEMQRP